MISILFINWYWSKVCANVDEVVCEVEPYTDCKMPQNDVFYNDTEEQIKTWPTIKCYDEQALHHQTKDHPICKNETKLNCIYTWHVDSEGNKVNLILIKWNPFKLYV